MTNADAREQIRQAIREIETGEATTDHLYAADVWAIRRLATGLLCQCDHYERNSQNSDDRDRFGIMLDLSLTAARRAQRGYRRLHRERGRRWQTWWRL